MEALENQIVKLIVEEGFGDYNLLPDYEKNNLLSIFIEQYDLECLATESILSKIKAYIKMDKFHHALELAHEIKLRLSEISEDQIQFTYYEKLDEIQYDKNIQSGLKPYRDLTNGEIRWIKP